MGLDYSQGCVNFRDVGEFVNLIAGHPLLPARRLLRGGKIDFVSCAEEIGHPGTIINLRGGPDTVAFEADLYQFPIANTYEKYDTSQREVRRWLNAIVSLFESEELWYPFWYIACPVKTARASSLRLCSGFWMSRRK
jgi:protein-tyrosine phosphatase